MVKLRKSQNNRSKEDKNNFGWMLMRFRKRNCQKKWKKLENENGNFVLVNKWSLEF